MITPEQISQVIFDELAYWRDQPDRNPESEAAEATDLIALGAIGALSNVVVSIMGDRPADWHKSHPHHPLQIHRQLQGLDPSSRPPTVL